MINSYPRRHLSIRVPWHDAKWNGTVCRDPKHNTACLKLTNISEKKNEEEEREIAGKSLQDLYIAQMPPCVRERAMIMADFPLDQTHMHPYATDWSTSHKHFAPTSLRYPAYSAGAVPFRWMLKSVVWGDAKKREQGLIHEYPLNDLNLDYEPDKKTLGFETDWIQDHRNHRVLLDCFWNHLHPDNSLVFFYAKQVPLVEDTGRRILIGVGRISKIGGLTEYQYKTPIQEGLRSLLWERMVTHSIRPDFKDGFLMPYHEVLEKFENGGAFDPAETIAFAPEDRLTEFSFAAEHVGNDAAIDALMAMRNALQRTATLINYDISTQERWINDELGRLWKKRGPFPGFGAVLGATGVSLGNFVAQALLEKIGDDGDIWQAWFEALKNPTKFLPEDLRRSIDSTIAKSWQRMPEDRLTFLALISRIDLTQEHASILAIPEQRKKAGIAHTDQDFLQNPYLIYEATRLTATPISIGVVDRGVFSTPFIRERFPISTPTRVETPVDARRLRALVIHNLERRALLGDTLAPQDEIILHLRNTGEEDNSGGTNVTADLLRVAEGLFEGEVRLVKTAENHSAYQLERFGKIRDLISNKIDRRLSGNLHQIVVDWRAALDSVLRKKSDVQSIAQDQESEKQARREKTAALEKLAESRFSILVGPAGTGKTTLLTVLCGQPEINRGGILLLAPTGKARVRMVALAKEAGAANFQARTLAQHLGQSKRYDAATQRYLLIDQPGEKGARTVIVDECSMLTEEMLGALLESLTGVDRLILVGDPGQLPPIGAGRPFADIIARIKPDTIESAFPRVASGYAELTVPRRHGSDDRDDLLLANWFGGRSGGPAEDEVFEILSGRRTSDTLRIVSWETPEELERLLPEVLAQELSFSPDLTEPQAFGLSLGGQQSGPYIYYNRGRSGKEAERWQILSPVRQQPWGVEQINRIVHRRYKGEQIKTALSNRSRRQRTFLAPQGEHQIVYGDKIINNNNWSVASKRLYPEPNDRGYLANGEIGIVVGQIRAGKFQNNPWCLQVEFSTQQGTTVNFYPSDFSDEADAKIELAYALTVHKAQGSEFETVFLILPRSPLNLNRELLYTALTRQRGKITVLLQGSATDLQKYSSDTFSATAARLTNLFGPPNPVTVIDRNSGVEKFLEKGLIHYTSRGEAVRSKSEVIIANLLNEKNIDYHYEYPLEIDGITKYPDFTIEDDDAGVTYYWEHCGMLHISQYRERWEKKRAWYKAHDILPYNEGGGARGSLIVTEDNANGGIDSERISTLLRNVFNV